MLADRYIMPQLFWKTNHLFACGEITNYLSWWFVIPIPCWDFVNTYTTVVRTHTAKQCKLHEIFIVSILVGQIRAFKTCFRVCFVNKRPWSYLEIVHFEESVKLNHFLCFKKCFWSWQILMYTRSSIYCIFVNVQWNLNHLVEIIRPQRRSISKKASL